MKAHQKVFALIIFIFLVAAGFVINAQKTNKDREEPDVTQFPILDYKKKSTSSESASQKQRKKYNNPYAVKISESSEGIRLINDWYVGLPALPIARSAAVIVGEVTQAQALLSEDETHIYSEFTVQLAQVIKDEGNSLGVGIPVIIERLGGRVRLPSGKVVVSQTDKQDLPRVGKRYVFFLTRRLNLEGEYEDFNILTGYELRNGKVFPLDKLSHRHPISAYTGTAESSFFADLNKALANTSTSQIR